MPWRSPPIAPGSAAQPLELQDMRARSSIKCVFSGPGEAMVDIVLNQTLPKPMPLMIDYRRLAKGSLQCKM